MSWYPSILAEWRYSPVSRAQVGGRSNPKTAKTLELMVPQSLLARTAEIIERCLSAPRRLIWRGSRMSQKGHEPSLRLDDCEGFDRGGRGDSSRKRPSNCAGKSLLIEAGLKPPILQRGFCDRRRGDAREAQRNADGRHRRKECRGTVPVGAERILVEDKCGGRAKFPIVGFVKDPAGVATLHTRQAGGKVLRLCQVGAGFNRQSSMEIREKLDAIVSSKPRLVKAPRLKGAS